MEYSVKRRHERFRLELPASVFLRGAPEGTQICYLVTRDISSSGAFLRTPVPYPAGAELDLELTLAAGGKCYPDTWLTNVRVSGTVLRVEPDGNAVAFGDDCQITPVWPDPGVHEPEAARTVPTAK